MIQSSWLRKPVLAIAPPDQTSSRPRLVLLWSQVFREDGLLSPSPNFGLDWFEGAVAKPDQVLQDFYTAYHPTGPVRGPVSLG